MAPCPWGAGLSALTVRSLQAWPDSDHERTGGQRVRRDRARGGAGRADRRHASGRGRAERGGGGTGTGRGECAYWACIPSKAMLRPVAAVADARRVAGARQEVTGTADASAVFARRVKVCGRLERRGAGQLAQEHRYRTDPGHGRLDGPRRRTDRCQGHRGAPRGRHRTGHPDPWKRAMSWRPTRCCSRPGAWKN